jgi:hypothetical protein
MEAYWRSGCIAPCILDLGTRWRWVISFKPRPLYIQGKSPWYPSDKRLGGLQRRSGRGEEKNSQPLSGLELPIIQPVAQRYTAELCRLFHGGHKWGISLEIYRRVLDQQLSWYQHFLNCLFIDALPKCTALWLPQYVPLQVLRNLRESISITGNVIVGISLPYKFC